MPSSQPINGTRATSLVSATHTAKRMSGVARDTRKASLTRAPKLASPVRYWLWAGDSGTSSRVAVDTTATDCISPDIVTCDLPFEELSDRPNPAHRLDAIPDLGHRARLAPTRAGVHLPVPGYASTHK